MPGLDRVERPPQRGLVEVAGDVGDGDELQRAHLVDQPGGALDVGEGTFL